MDDGAVELACRFAAALAARNRDELLDLLAPDVDFHGMTPGRTWSAPTVERLVDDVLLGAWFEPTDHVDELVSVETGRVGDRTRVGYQMTVTNDDGQHVVEHQAYLSERGGRIDWMRVMCSGFRPVRGGTDTGVR